MRILFVTHHYGGGTERHVADLRALLAPEVAVEVLRPDGAGGVVLENSRGDLARIGPQRVGNLVDILSLRGYERIHVHHVLGFDPFILDLPHALGIEYDVTLHDYYPICPQYALVTAEGEYCGEPDESACADCVAARPNAWNLSVREWRTRMHGFLLGANRVIAPSDSVRVRIHRHFPDVEVTVRAHPPRAEWIMPVQASTKVVILGDLSRIKGLDTLIECARFANVTNSPIAFELLGHPRYVTSDWDDLPIRVLGEYDDKDLPTLLALTRADVVWFPARWPETYSYTLDVALASGLPIVATSFGAIAERLSGISGARVLPLSTTPDEWNRALVAAGKEHRQVGRTQRVSGGAGRLNYREFLLEWASVKGLQDTKEVTAEIELPASDALPPSGPDLSMSALFEHGVICGHIESRRALRARAEAADRSFDLLDSYSVQFGKPWYDVLNEVHGERTRWRVRTARLVNTARARGHALAVDRERISALHATIGDQRGRLEQQLAKIEARQLRVQELEQQLGQREEELGDARARITGILESWSWRITAPLRTVNSWRRTIVCGAASMAEQLRTKARAWMQTTPVPASTSPDPSYGQRVSNELAHFRNVADVHALPEICHYWSNKYLPPKLRAIGVENFPELFIQYLTAAVDSVHAQNVARFVSVGAGNCDFEIDLARRLEAAGRNAYEFHCLDINGAMLARGRELATAAGFGHRFRFIEADINAWEFSGHYDVAMANQSLHHFVELEMLFDKIAAAIGDTGVFLVSDMIGRNGHQRWPEALVHVERLWARLDSRHKYNYQLGVVDEQFVNRDCSTEGFEGIRAQDILPLLNARFCFERFVAFGNLIHIFIDRAYGHNFDPADPTDVAFIDDVAQFDDALIDSGEIKPTQMLAAMRTRGCAPMRVYRHWTPQFCIRPVDAGVVAPSANT